MSEYNATAGGVIWITGLAQVGKTTTPRTLAAALEARGRRPVLLDGDAMRLVLDTCRDHKSQGGGLQPSRNRCMIRGGLAGVGRC